MRIMHNYAHVTVAHVRLYRVHVRGQRAMYTCIRVTGEWSLHSVLFWLWSLHSVRASLTRDDIVRNYFKIGFPYNLILCFLVAIHGIYISLSTRRAGASVGDTGAWRASLPCRSFPDAEEHLLALTSSAA